MADQLAARVTALCVDLEASGIPLARESAAAIRERLQGPLRLAVAGRVKAGKSTLLNALVQERLAPTDAGECTKFVTWYRHGPGYRVEARFDDGSLQEVPFRREDGQLEFDVTKLPVDRLDRFEVEWPARTLTNVTLIDTPGVGSLDPAIRARALAFLAGETDEPREADAIVYLMMHGHRTDTEFLDTFLDRSLLGSSPVNAVAVLSRPDEIAAGRSDAMDSATTIAARYQGDPRVRGLVSAVLPVAGLLAETGATLREDETDWLRQVASLPRAEVAAMLLSVDRFTRVDWSPLTSEVRVHLLDRFGIYGLRFALDALSRSGSASTAELSRALIEQSGIAALRTFIDTHFASRAGRLKARVSLRSLRDLAQDLEDVDPATARALVRSVDEITASTHELEELRMAHLLATGGVALGATEQEELGRLLYGTTAPQCLGAAAEASTEELRVLALTRIAQWRARAADPILDRQTAGVCGGAVRSYEGLLLALDETR